MPMDGRLYEAAESGDMKVLREYKDQLITRQLTPYKNTVLHIAAGRKFTNFSQLIPFKNTFLHKAAAHCTNFSYEDAEDFLAIVSQDLLFCLNSNRDTCIHVAAREGNFNLIKAIIGYMKPNSPAELEGGIESVHELLRISNSEGNTALHEAVMHRRHRVVKMLVREDAGFTYPPNNASKSPLFLALEKEDEYSAKVILRDSRSPSYAGPYGTTALHAAALIRYRRYDCLERILPAGCLERILPAGCSKMILTKNPSLIKQVDHEGWSPLHFAAFLGSSRTVRVLLKKDKQMAYETIKEDNKAPLHLAALNNRSLTVKEIIKQCPDSNEAVTSHGHNALRLAWLNGSLNVVCFYLGCFRLILQCHNNLRYATQSSDPGVVIHHPYLEQTDRRWRGKEVKNELAEDNDSWKERINTHLVVATLIMTIAFAAGFTIPGGYDDDDGPNKGTAILARKAAFKVFVVADTLAMICSASAIFLHFTATLKQGTMAYTRYIWAARVILIAMLATVIAFTTGLYAVLPFKDLAIVVSVMCSVSLYCFMFVFDLEWYLQSTGLDF
ncbi:ankyrin repeat-containing protein At5g02620-like [Lycium barbarum]|uniref:ankyrin repeat-containing protein At5g02620-like n=1 Tax=Lycium barbarum TaxID=112863 RepID=UPI00293E973A|nr:ankyrin repeat-containing protein At5g02620-like [Lycium barbarum]